MWNRESIHAAVEAQREFFLSGETLDIGWRLAQLKALKSAILSERAALEEAL